MNEVEAYLRAAAAARGMDPDKIVRAAMTEGGVSDPYRQSGVVKNGRRERSYGPLQLYIDGGVGNRAIAEGIDPRTDWKGGIDFGLDYLAKKGSWNEWYGPQNAGLPLDYGIKGARPIGYKPGGMTLTSSPYAGMADGPKGQESYPRMAPPLPPPTNVKDYAVAEVNPAMTTDPGSLEGLKGLLGKMNGGPEGTGFADLAAAFGGGESGSSVPQIQPSSVGPSVSNEIASKAASAQAMMSQLLEARRARTKRRVPGMSLMG
jgi:hypothetical protein